MFALIYNKKTKCFPFYKTLSTFYKFKAVCFLNKKKMTFKA